MKQNKHSKGWAQGVRGQVVGAGVALVVLAGCGSGGLSAANGPNGPGITNPIEESRQVLLQSQELQVDLPGRVTAFVQVVDQSGGPVPGLIGTDFKLYEDNAPVSVFESGQRTLSNPQSFRAYSHLLIDRSGSIGNTQGTIAAIKEGARNYVRTLFGSELIPNTDPPEYTAYDPDRLNTTFSKLSWFDGSNDIYEISGYETGFTNEPELLLLAIDHLFDEPPFNTSTNLFGAVLYGLDDLDEVDLLASGAGIENRTLTLVTFTDGTHRANNGTTLEQVTNRLAPAAVGEPAPYASFAIGVGAEVDLEVLQGIGQSGYAFSTNTEELQERFDDAIELVSRLANSFYVLSYRSPSTGNSPSLTISASPMRLPGDPTLSFSAQGFGAGAAFPSLRAQPALAGTLGGFTFRGAMEDAEGRVVAVGWRGADCVDPGCAGLVQAIVARFRPNGTLDPAFGAGGVVELEGVQTPSGATAVVGGQGASLLISGWRRSAAAGGVAKAVVWELETTSGLATVHEVTGTGLEDAWLNDLVFEGGANARLYACGRVTAGGAPVAAVWRWPLSNIGDSAMGWFYSDQAAAPNASREARALALHGIDGVVVVGDGPTFVASTVNGGRDVLVTRHATASGELDVNFGSAGRVTATEVCLTPPPTSIRVFPGRAEDLRVDSQDRIVVAGTLFSTSGTTPAQQPALWRFLPTGQPDRLAFSGSASTPFYRSGVVTLRTGSTNDPQVNFGRNSVARSLTLGPLDQVVITGNRLNFQSDRDMALISFAENGVPDTYNFVGFVIDDGAVADDSDDRGHVVLRHSNGNLWVLGVSSDGVATAAQGVPVVWIDEDTEGLFGG